MSCSGEVRLGYSFNNPDLTSNNGWGNILTPDELRYVYAFGNDLVAPNSQTITDETVQWYIDQAVANVEKDLNVTLIKKKYRHTPINTEGTFPARTELDEEGEADIDYIWEDPYDFDRKSFNDFIYIKLRHRPVIEVKKVDFRDPTGNLVANIQSWRKVNYKMGSVEFFPHAGALMSLPLYSSGSFYGSPVRFRDNYPDAYFIDYDAGFKTVRHLHSQWKEIFIVVGKLAAINMLSDYGDGKTAAVASSSLSLDGISESLSTTLSATSAAFGARILQYQKDLSTFYKNNKYKYGGLQIGSL